MVKYNQYTLNKLEAIFKESEIQVRYGKGAFTSGYCILETKNIVVVNKYYSIEARINILIELLRQVKIIPDLLSDASLKLFNTVAPQEQMQTA